MHDQVTCRHDVMMMMLTDDGARLDFSTFSIKAPETTGACTTDYFQATNAATGENSN